MDDYKNITLEADEEGIWLIDETDEGPMQMGSVSWYEVNKYLERHKREEALRELTEIAEEFGEYD